LQPDRFPNSRENRQTAVANKEFQDGQGRPETLCPLESPFPPGTINAVPEKSKFLSFYEFSNAQGVKFWTTYDRTGP